MQVLLVEDQPLVAEAIQAGLEEVLHATVTWAGNGALALKVIRRTAPDLAIIDLGLPDISGLAVARSAVDAHIPALMMTGYSDQIALCELEGFPCLGKPFSTRDLIARADEIVRKALVTAQQSELIVGRVQQTLLRVRTAREQRNVEAATRAQRRGGTA